jgi:hypothetical protein
MYFEDRMDLRNYVAGIRQEVGAAIKRKMKTLDIRVQELGRAIYGDLGLRSPEAAQEYIARVRNANHMISAGKFGKQLDTVDAGGTIHQKDIAIYTP